MNERQQLEQAIAAQETLRGTLDNAIIDAAIAALKEKLSVLESPLQQRKLATILFVDIAGSTRLTQGMDPEEQMALIDPLVQRMAIRVSEHGGHVSRYQGDGFKAVFGLPVAQENDPTQAIRAGLAIQSEAANIAEELADFQVRVGIATGLVFSGGETEGEDTIKGEAVNLAARLESAAQPGTVLISHGSYKHVRGIFDFEPLGPVEVKGFSAPVAIYQVLRAKERPFYRGMRGVEGVETRLVGRELEFLQLKKIMRDVIEEGEGQMVTVVGDAGLGKSRLLYEFENWADLLPEQVWLYKGRARLETQNLPYGLLRDMFAFRFSIQEDDRAQVVKDKLEKGFAEGAWEGEASEKQAHILGQLLGYGFEDSPHLKGVLENPQQLRDQAMMYMAEFFRSFARRNPVLVLFEDLHWADDTSLDAINVLAEDLKTIPVLILGTTRHSLLERRPHWGEGQDFLLNILLKPLSKRESRKLVAEVLQRVQEVPEALSDLVVGNAEGNPFYVEELIKMLVEDGVIIRDDPYWRVEISRLEEVYVPSTLTGVLQARLDGLPAEERRTLQGASVIGRVFWDRILEHINGSLGERITERQVSEVLDELRSRELIFRRETSSFDEAQEHIFKHALLREVTYESVLKRVRQAYHAMVAEWLIEHAGDREGEFTGLIADHLELAGKEKDAFSYLAKAGNDAAAKYANEEAIRFFNRALELLKSQQETIERAKKELDILLSLGPSLIAVRGFNASDYERTYTRAGELASQTGQVDRLFFAIWNQRKYWRTVGDDEKAQALNKQLFQLAEQSGDENLLLEAHHSAWTMETSFGNILTSLDHINEGLKIYKPTAHKAHIHIHGHDPGVCALSTRAINLWILGYPEQAKQSAIDGQSLSKQFKHPFSSFVGSWGIIWTLFYRGEFEQVVDSTDAWLTFVAEHSLDVFSQDPLLLLGSSLVKLGNIEEGFAKIREVQRLNKTIFEDPYDKKTLIEYLSACLNIGAVDEGLNAVEEMMNKFSLTGQSFRDNEIRRLYGEMILADDPDRIEEADAEFNLAIEISQRQHAKSLELRAVTSLVRLWQRQGKIKQAHERLTVIYNWFTEGFDTQDLKEAKALLEELKNQG